MSEKSPTIVYGMYLAIFIDLLGHRDLYKKIEVIPPPGSPNHAEFTEVVTKFIRQIHFLKEDVDKFFQGYDSYKSELPWPEHLDEFRERMKRHVCKIQRFSDGLVIFVPLQNDGSHFPIGSVYRALAGAALVMLNSLARGSPVRGGIAVGGGVELDDGQLFGPVVGMAYELESTVAQYPRIAVHPSFLEYVHSHTSIDEPQSEEQRYLKLMGQVCSEMIIDDVDGIPILHYMGDAILGRIFSNSEEPLFGRALEFAASSLKQFQEDGNSKLAIRYLMLRIYLETHASGISE